MICDICGEKMGVEYDDRRNDGFRKLVCECGNIIFDAAVMAVDEFINEN